MALSPFPSSLTGMGAVRVQRIPIDPTQNTRATRRPRPMSHYNSFQTVCVVSNDEPPCYAVASRLRVPDTQPEDRLAPPPAYTCTVAAESKLQLCVESVNPLGELAEHDWRDVHAILRGTALHLHKVKKDGELGKLLRSYTLQHAEIGLAVDTSYSVLVPQNRLARLVPAAVRKIAWQKDPDLFKPVKQTILRLRVETDQILLADTSEERIFEWINSISAAIDISPPIDDRSLPLHNTVPRRRRRRAHHTVTGDLTDPAVVAEQERLMRNMYPTFAERQTETQTDSLPTTTTDGANVELAPMTGREEDELDLNIMREDFAPSPDSSVRPTMSRHTTASSLASTIADGMIASTPANFNAAGKWEPPHPRTLAQAQRYIRRCMPILHADAVRASDVLINRGMRVKINRRMDILETWELKPPSYRSHHFHHPNREDTPLERSDSRASGSATSSRETDDIEVVESGRLSPVSGVDLDKVSSVDRPAKVADRTTRADADSKRVSVPEASPGLHSMAYCF